MLMKICRAIVFGFSCCWAMMAAAAPLEVVEDVNQIVISRGQTPVLTYHKAEMPPPPGETELFRRSGFIHPLHAPNGDVVTSIHPADHIHHMGLWHAWVKTKWQGEEIDFWNLKGGRGTVRFVEVIDRNSLGFKVRQQQVALAYEDRAETVVLDETLEVSVTSSAQANVIDYTITQTNVSDAVLELPAYRYGGGITFRAPETWGEPDDSYVTSTGLDRTEGHATRGDWVVMHGPTEQGSASVVIMGHPTNHDAPQRMRIWPKGKVFFNYAPTQEFDWRIAPAETVVLRYRVVVDSHRLVSADVAPWWRDYAKID